MHLNLEKSECIVGKPGGGRGWSGLGWGRVRDLGQACWACW